MAVARAKYDVIIVNYANPDMVGHTGVFEAAVKAMETVDACVEAMSAFGVRDVLTGGPFIMGLSSGEGESN